jgi:glycosyltransferase involved in cell wall biosynthesis
MRVWLIKIGEPLPVVDGPDKRLMRVGLLAEHLVAAGHDVTWWASSFSHHDRRHRCEGDKTVEVSGAFRIHMIEALGYRGSRSLARLRDNAGVARRFRRLVSTEPRPDVILSAMPTPGLCLAAVDYGRHSGVPVAIDIRDLWPDCFVSEAPWFARPLAWLMFRPMARALRRACRQATAILGITRPYLEYGLRYAGREAGDLERVFPHGYPRKEIGADELEEARRFWAEQGLAEGTGRFVACFFGTISHDFDLETVIGAARLLDAKGLPFTFELCGAGDRLDAYKALSKGLSSVLFPGWVGSAQIRTLMQRSTVGLTPYFTRLNFEGNITNKPIEYLSSGLPIVSSLRGILADLLAERGCGVTYANGDAEELASILEGLHGDRTRVERMSRNALAVFEERFMAEKVYAEMVEHLERIAASGGPSGG